MKNIYLLLLLAVVMLATSCSKDYRSSIPAGCQALVAVNLMETGKQIGIADDKGKQSALQAIFMVGDIQKTGIDLTSPVYIFETAGGDFGLVASVSSRSAVEDWFSILKDKGICKELGEKKGYPFFLLKESFVAALSGDALMIMGPVVATEQSRKQLQMAKYLDAKDGEGIMQSKLFERLETLSGAVTMVARASALPEKIVAPMTLGAPKGTDPSEIIVTTEMNVSNAMLHINGSVFSFNAAVDDALQKAVNCYRPFRGRYLDKIPATVPFALMANVAGADYLKLMRTNEALRTMMLGINTAIDFDKMISSVDGDMVVMVPNFTSEKKLSASFIAEAKNSDWIKDVDYWKKSCPVGTVISSVATGSLPQYTMIGPSVNASFGMAASNTLYISVNNGAKSAAAVTLAPAKALSPDVAAMVKGKRMCVVASLDELMRQKKELSVVTDMLRPLFGNVNTLVYTLE